MRRDRMAKLQQAMDDNQLDGLLLFTSGATAYATGAAVQGADSGRAALFRNVAAVVRGDPAPHLFTPYPEGAPPELPADHLHPPLYPDADGAEARLAGAVAEVFGAGARVGVDEQPWALAGGAGVDLVGAAAALAAAKLCKTPDELACIRTAQHLNERAMLDVQPMLRPGVRQTDLSAAFLRRVFELGATANAIDPIWQAMPATRAAGPWTVHGGVAFPTPSTDRALAEGEVIWVDTGVAFHGYASDFGRTWIVAGDPRPTARQQAQCQRWQEVVAAALDRCRPGTTGLELDRAAVAANGGVVPWIEHFYLAHGVGTDSAEMPLVGTDRGEAFDDSIVLQPGMVLVFEPVIWDEGAAGYRSEEMVVVTDDGWSSLCDYPLDPYQVAP
jgi:Xaa-Pro dipeptidase